jgi:hypothetical protein
LKISRFLIELIVTKGSKLTFIQPHIAEIQPRPLRNRPQTASVRFPNPRMLARSLGGRVGAASPWPSVRLRCARRYRAASA